MKLYGLIGKSLKHSASPAIYQEIFEREGRADCRYQLFELSDISALPTLLKAEPDLLGLNVTFPYKELIIPYLDDLDKAGNEIGAVNVVTVERLAGKIRLTGHNSDWKGFSESLSGEILPEQALILGTGGAARAVAHALRKRGTDYLFVSRNDQSGDLRYEEVDDRLIGTHRLIVNCTPLGTAGLYEEEIPALPYHALTAEHFLYDLVYNPDVTPFLRKGIEQGAKIQNGFPMLQKQAEVAWKLFQGKTA